VTPGCRRLRQCRPDFFLAHIDIVEIATAMPEAQPAGTPPATPPMADLTRASQTLPPYDFLHPWACPRRRQRIRDRYTTCALQVVESCAWPVLRSGSARYPEVDPRHDYLHWSDEDARSRSSSWLRFRWRPGRTVGYVNRALPDAESTAVDEIHQPRFEIRYPDHQGHQKIRQPGDVAARR